MQAIEHGEVAGRRGTSLAGTTDGRPIVTRSSSPPSFPGGTPTPDDEELALEVDALIHELGVDASSLEVEAYLYGALVPSDHDRNVIAVALNERFAELGR